MRTKIWDRITFTKAVLNGFLRFGIFLGVCPIRWDKEGNCLTVLDSSIRISHGRLQLKLNQKHFWLIYHNGIALTRFAYLIFIVYRACTLQISAIERILSYFYVSILATGVVHQIYFIYNVKMAVDHVSRLATFNIEACKTFQYKIIILIINF